MDTEARAALEAVHQKWFENNETGPLSLAVWHAACAYRQRKDAQVCRDLIEARRRNGLGMGFNALTSAAEAIESAP